MTCQRFEDPRVWNAAIELAGDCEHFLSSAKDRITSSRRDRLERASLSVYDDIAGGFERGTTNESLNFIHIARGSAGEVRSMLNFFDRRPALQDFESQISNLELRAESCSKQLRKWAESLHNFPIRGQRHLNDAERNRHEQRKKADNFLEQLSAVLPDGHPAKKSPKRK